MQRLTLPLIILIVLIVLIAQSVFTVDSREKALITRFGKIERSNLEPGLNFKVPFVDTVRRFDARVHTSDLKPEVFITNEKKNILVDSFVKWRVADEVLYYRTVQGRIASADARLRQRVNNNLRIEFSRRELTEAISGDRVKIMETVRKAVDEEANKLGVEVVEVRVKKVDFEDTLSESVFNRMRSERAQFANQRRSEGKATAERIMAEADRKVRVLIAEAERDAEKLRGEGDAEATRIYAQAYGKDTDFYKLYRTLNAYKDTFANKSDVLVLEPDSPFFEYFSKGTQ